MDIIPDLEEEIFLRLPLKSILKFKTLSKKWRTTLESKMFTERRMKIQKKRKILAAAGDKDRTKPRFSEDEEEMEMVYLHCDDAKKPSLTCDGLVCIPVPGWFNVLNPSTGEFLRFPSGSYRGTNHWTWWTSSPWPWVIGFGKDKVNGSYKIVRMFFIPNRYYCEILDLNIGEWRIFVLLLSIFQKLVLVTICIACKSALIVNKLKDSTVRNPLKHYQAQRALDTLSIVRGIKVTHGII